MGNGGFHERKRKVFVPPSPSKELLLKAFQISEAFWIIFLPRNIWLLDKDSSSYSSNSIQTELSFGTTFLTRQTGFVTIQVAWHTKHFYVFAQKKKTLENHVSAIQRYTEIKKKKIM